MTMGGAAKVIASVVTYPYQVIKSRLQQRDQVLNTPRYQGVMHCARSILKYIPLLSPQSLWSKIDNIDTKVLMVSSKDWFPTA
jgi:hypothetical protein